MKKPANEKTVTCNKCGTKWETYIRKDERLRCPVCKSNESLSIR